MTGASSPLQVLPWWQAGAARLVLPEQPLPAQTDVLVVGGGSMGLAAARETAAAGLATCVLEAGLLGTGCSGRNGGQIAHSLKPSFAKLRTLYGAQRAFAICREGFLALDYLRALCRELDCEWRECGCFFGAHTARHFERMAHEARHQPAGLEQRITVVPLAEQHEEIQSEFYHGGCVYHDDASVDPMKMLLGLADRCRRAGAAVLEGCEAQTIRRKGNGFEVLTSRGSVLARKVLIATNGYSGPLSAWHRRRVIPIGSYQIATERLGKERVQSLIPRGRNIVDSRRVVVYFRPSPDGERIIFGGRAALAERDPLACVPRLHAMLAEIFPALADVELHHAWVGWVAYTFDTLPHLGCRDGIYYCMGYCGQGVPLAPYFGMKIGRQMAGAPEADTALDGLAFPTRPYYFGTPWFLAPAVAANRLLDRLGV